MPGRRARYTRVVTGEGLAWGHQIGGLPGTRMAGTPIHPHRLYSAAGSPARNTAMTSAKGTATSGNTPPGLYCPGLLIEPRLDEGPASVDEEGNAECEHDDFGTGHSVSRKCGNVVGFDAKRFNVGLRLMLLPWAGAALRRRGVTRAAPGLPSPRTPACSSAARPWPACGRRGPASGR